MTTPHAATPTFTVECFGVPRLLAGPAVECAGATLTGLARDLGERRPSLRGAVLDPATDWLLPGYVFVVDGQFTRDPDAPLAPGCSVLLVSSAAGG
jgi:hypothetical protein